MSAHNSIFNEGLAEWQQPRESFVRTQYDIASSTTLVAVPGLVATVEAGKRYRIQAHLFLTVGSTGLAKVAIGSGTSGTPTSIKAAIKYVDFTTPGVTGGRVTAIDTAQAVAVAQTSFEVEIEGYIEPSADGTITITFAQSVSNGTNSSVLVGSNFRVHEMIYPTTDQ